ncbi:MAG: DUF2269 family protein [Alphaproteobacteria bacterium]|nr:DUF2269 family protein [Alphaproteobacteria bacterium]
MRKTLKILHTLATCGLIGGMAVYGILLLDVPRDAAAHADLRAHIAAISNWVLLPSLGIALVSGLVAMAVHRPFLEKRWAWLKAALGILMFKGVLTLIGAKAGYAARVAGEVARGEAPADALDGLLTYEWWTLGIMMALSVLNVVLGVWRPRLKATPARIPAARAGAPAE